MESHPEARGGRHDGTAAVGVRVATLAPTQPSQVISAAVPHPIHRHFLFTARSSLYTLLLLAVASASGAYGVRKYGIFNCQASAYGPDTYLSYCAATSYGDYDHGAVWFGLEPAATAAAASSRVLFLGNSRTQFAFSTKATADWFSSISKSYYLLGFSHFENSTFELPLIRKLDAQATVYVINIDSFFDRTETGPGKTVMRDQAAMTRYEEKRRWQSIHEASCTAVKALCGNREAIFRSRSTGSWVMRGGRFTSEPVSYNENLDEGVLASYIALEKELLPGIPGSHSCIIMTIIPTVKTEIGTARAVAAALGRDLIAPRLSGLVTFDGVHLDERSAQRWSRAFFDEAGPQIRKCLNNR